jgi:phage gpG-like protein
MQRITVRNEDIVARRLRLYGKKLDTWRSLWRRIARDVAEAEVAWFATRGAGSWPPLSPDYARYKARRWPGRPILVREGDLIQSLTMPTRLLQERGPNTAVIGTRVPYAGYHQTGTIKMPRRAPLIPNSQSREIIRAALQDHIEYR